VGPPAGRLQIAAVAADRTGLAVGAVLGVDTVPAAHRTPAVERHAEEARRSPAGRVEVHRNPADPVEVRRIRAGLVEAHQTAAVHIVEAEAGHMAVAAEGGNQVAVRVAAAGTVTAAAEDTVLGDTVPVEADNPAAVLLFGKSSV